MIELALILLLLLANGVFAMAEIALISARRARLQQMAEEGHRGAQRALELSRSPDRFLSTVQVGITLVGILAGAFGGARLSEALGAVLAPLPVVGPYSSQVAFGLVVVLITYLSLIIGELVPKQLALGNPERIASFMAAPMGLLSKVSAPVVSLLSLSSNAVVWMLGVRKAAEPSVTEEELRILLEQGTRAGVFQEAEQEIVERVFRLGDRKVSSLMTPRTEMVWLDLGEPWPAALKKIITSGYSYFPVCDGRVDNVVGVASVKTVLGCLAEGRAVDLRAIMVAPVIVPEAMPAFKVLELFRQSGRHFALVLDEYGGVSGVLTINDFLQALVGVTDATHKDEAMVATRADGSVLVSAWMPVADFKDHFDLRHLPGEKEGSFQTIGGFILYHLGHIPAVAEAFEVEGLRFEVVDMDGQRIDKILVSRTAPVAAEE